MQVLLVPISYRPAKYKVVILVYIIATVGLSTGIMDVKWDELLPEIVAFIIH